jgi:hemerythrin-like domain-containing protein
MANAPDTPADTTMMRIVHDALRRDLARARVVLAEPRTPGGQRRVIGTHLAWMMRFLHAHHAAEDDGLYPVARERAGTGAEVEVLDRMSRDHEAIASLVAQVQAAATVLVADGSDAAARRTVVAVDALCDALLPHLRAEEDDAMPLVSRLVTSAEWTAIDKEHNLDPKSMAELGFEGHWLIDSSTDADRATVLGLLPPVPRFLLLHGYARRYRRHTQACWGRDDGRPPHRVQLENRVTVTVDADIDQVWDVVCDVTRVGEWSHECVGAVWLAGADEPTPGARFRGRNRAGVLRWGRVCEIVSADPHELVWITVPTARYPDSSEWRIRLAKVEAGTKISQQFRVLRAPKALAVLYALAIPAHRDRTAALVADLTRLGTVAHTASEAPISS